MGIESEIISQLKKEQKSLLPVPGLEFQFIKKLQAGMAFHPDFQAVGKFQEQRFRIIGEVVVQHSSAIFSDKLLKLNAYTTGKTDCVSVIVARYLSPDRQKKCKDAGINFIDLSGNVLFIYGSLYIERVGFPNRFPEKRRGRGPFSDKASLILRLLLSQKNKMWGIRELAGSVNLDPGFVSRMARELEKRNYAVRVNSKIRIRSAKSILDDWVHEYNYKKNRDLKLFLLASDPEVIIKKLRNLNIPEDINYMLGLHAGGSLVAPYAAYNLVHIYIQSQQNADYFITQLKLREADQGENIVLLFPFYKQSAFYGKQKSRGLWVASDIQLYLDLYNYPLRGLEQAEHLFKKRLAYLNNI
jgi:hypothetical protein